MSDRVFLDTNVLVYALGRQDDRTPAADALLAGGGVVSVQVLNELASVARRKLRMPWPEVIAALADIQILCPFPVPTTVAIHDSALTLASRLGFNFYDALIVAAALEAKCNILYSEDLQDGQVIERRLTIRNPFSG
jgi:predicted nucleic acid-binding protein